MGVVSPGKRGGGRGKGARSEKWSFWKNEPILDFSKFGQSDASSTTYILKNNMVKKNDSQKRTHFESEKALFGFLDGAQELICSLAFIVKHAAALELRQAVEALL